MYKFMKKFKNCDVRNDNDIIVDFRVTDYQGKEFELIASTIMSYSGSVDTITDKELEKMKIDIINNLKEKEKTLLDAYELKDKNKKKILVKRLINPEVTKVVFKTDEPRTTLIMLTPDSLPNPFTSKLSNNKMNFYAVENVVVTEI